MKGQTITSNKNKQTQTPIRRANRPNCDCTPFTAIPAKLKELKEIRNETQTTMLRMETIKTQRKETKTKKIYLPGNTRNTN